MIALPGGQQSNSSKRQPYFRSRRLRDARCVERQQKPTFQMSKDVAPNVVTVTWIDTKQRYGCHPKEQTCIVTYLCTSFLRFSFFLFLSLFLYHLCENTTKHQRSGTVVHLVIPILLDTPCLTYFRQFQFLPPGALPSHPIATQPARSPLYADE